MHKPMNIYDTPGHFCKVNAQALWALHRNRERRDRLERPQVGKCRPVWRATALQTTGLRQRLAHQMSCASMGIWRAADSLCEGGRRRGGGAGISKAGKPAVASRDLEVRPVDREWEFGMEET